MLNLRESDIPKLFTVFNKKDALLKEPNYLFKHHYIQNIKIGIIANFYWRFGFGSIN